MADPDFKDSLLNLGQLLGIIDPDGSINWVWFSDPETQILGKAGDATVGLANRRQFLGPLIRHLKGDATTPPLADDTFSEGYSWVPLNDNDIKVGFVWSKSTPELQIGFGAQANYANSGKPVDLSALAKFLKIQDGKITPLLGDVLLQGSLNSPPLDISVELQAGTTAPNVQLGIQDTKTANGPKRNLTFSQATIANANASTIFAWDCTRITLFVLEAWLHDQPVSAALATRVSNHLFPMFGEPAQPSIAAFPLFGQASMGTMPNFQPWENSVLDFSGSGAGALAFLWHLRALVTGNESAGFLKGSLFMPLVGGPAGGSPPTDPTVAAPPYDPTTIAQAGVYIGIANAASVFTLCLDIVTGLQVGNAKNFLRIQLAQLSGGVLSRPPAPSAADLFTYLNQLPPASGLTAVHTGNLWTVTYTMALTGTGVQFLDGAYTFSAALDTTAPNTPVRFEVGSVLLPVTLTFPPGAAPAPPTPAALVASIASWIVKAIPTAGPSDPATKLAKVVGDLATFIKAELTAPGSGKVLVLVTSIGKALADGLSLQIVKGPPFEFDIKLGATPSPPPNDSFFHVVTTASYGPINIDQIPDFPISIGKLSGTLDLAVDRPGNPLWGFNLGFDDLRLGSDAMGNASGLIATLIPDLKQAPGFTFNFAWDTAQGISISGGGKIPIQLTLGPLSLSQLQVDANNSSLSIGINLTFQLAVITISTYDLGVGFDYKSKTPSLNLSGLGLNFDGGGIKLSGLFLNNKGDYIGGASVAIEDLFALTAIGGYTKLQNTASLFIFASLVAPLGGPPYFFITGIAGGFGYNRTLPPLTLLSKHPFIKIMNGDIDIGDPKTGLAALDAPGFGFAPKIGDFWIAAGLQFTSFGFIQGKIVVAVAFGHDFSFNLLGIASFGLSPVAYFEIDILVTVDTEKFLLIAGVSPNSYLIHPDIFNLSGDFGLGVWHSGPHQGDFLVSIGGFHPYFKTPDYYPALNRVSVKAEVFGFVHLSIECFFACTPQALMAGASVSLSATFAGIGAGLDVYVDVLIQWDPFYILATMGVTVWFEFLGRHEIGVDLQIHTPPFGGTATIHLFIVSFDISFGSDLQSPPPPPVFDFVTKRLNVPAKAFNTNGAALSLFNTDTVAGLVRVLFITGRTTGDKADGTKAQEGTNANKPVKVAPEFSFVVRTHLPFLESDGDLASPPVTSLGGTVNLPLCGESDLSSTLTVTIFDVQKNANLSVPSSDIARSADFFPYANFGATALPAAQADKDSARQAISSIDTTHPAVALTDGFYFNLVAQPQPPAQTTMVGPEEQLSDLTENYPLPLGWPAGMQQVTVSSKSRLVFAANAKATQLAVRIKPKKTIDRRLSALQQMTSSGRAPWKIGLMNAQFARSVITIARPATSVAAIPAGAVSMAPPASPARRVELAAVTLRVLAAHTAAAPARLLAPTRQILVPTHSILVAPAIGQLANIQLAAPVLAAITVTPAAVLSVLSGHAAHLDIAGNAAAPKGFLNFTGTQTVRAIFLSGFGEPIADQYIVGAAHVALPARTRRVVLIGEGALIGAPASLGSVGVEPASKLFAITRTEFAGHGCVVRSNAPILGKFSAGDTVTGSQILSVGNSFSILFPAAALRLSALVITVTPTVPNPADAASQVRWRGAGATLASLSAIATPDGAAFVMDAQAAAAWSLDLDVGSDWKFASAVVTDMSSSDALTTLRTHTSWSFVDDRFLAPEPPVSTSVTLELS